MKRQAAAGVWCPTRVALPGQAFEASDPGSSEAKGCSPLSPERGENQEKWPLPGPSRIQEGCASGGLEAAGVGLPGSLEVPP